MTRTQRPALPLAFFLPAQDDAREGGQRFCLFHPPQGLAPGDASRGRVLYLHPFAEELNTTRRVVAQQARALAQAGCAVLQIDLLGCGDSSGDFADATWEAWQADARRAHDWLSAHASGPLWLWGMRAGALLASDLVNTLDEPANLLLWQPVVSGHQQLQQFLRLRAAGQWLSAGGTDPHNPAQMLAQAQAVDIAGYRLSPALAEGLGAARLQPPATQPPGRLVWLELSTAAVPALSPASDKQLATWHNAGWQVQAQALTGSAFWQTVGTDQAPALTLATLAALTASIAPVLPGYSALSDASP